jgi:hypothetical protein
MRSSYDSAYIFCEILKSELDLHKGESQRIQKCEAKMNNIGPIAVVCSGLLMVAYWGGLDPLLVALGVLGLLGYVAFASKDAFQRKPPSDRPPWYMD